MTPVCLQWKHRKAHVSICSYIKLALGRLLFVSTIKDDSLSLSHSLFAGEICSIMQFLKENTVILVNKCLIKLKQQLCKQRHFLNIICIPCLNIMSVYSSEKRKPWLILLLPINLKQAYFHKTPLRSQFSCTILSFLHTSDPQARTEYERKVSQQNL